MSNLQDEFDEHKPSLFELLSEQQLSSLLSPSIRYVLAVATHRHPRYLLRILNSFDELYALVMLLVERHFLRTHLGGFTENFYGLKRERVLRVKGGEIPRAQQGAPAIVRETLALRRIDIWKNLAVMVGLPYIKRKLDESYDIHARQVSLLGARFQGDFNPNATFKQKIMLYYKWFLRNVYPSVNAAYYFAMLAFNLAYLFDGSKYHSPFLWLIGTRVRRLGETDHQAIALLNEPKAPTGALITGARPTGSSIFHPRTMATTVYPRLLSSLKFLLPASIFALKFLEWWHASDFARQLSRKTAEGMEIPPPISSGLNEISKLRSSLRPSDSGNKSPAAARSFKRKPPIASESLLPILTVDPPESSTSGLCPICLSPIQTPTACQTGFVFCYTCIYKWVDGSHVRQTAFMEGGGNEEGWGDEEGTGRSREGKWESGKGRCAVTGRRVLGGTEGLRRVMA